MTPNIIEMPPMPNASVRTTTVVNPRFFARTRQPKRKSCQNISTDLPRFQGRAGAKRVNVTTPCIRTHVAPFDGVLKSKNWFSFDCKCAARPLGRLGNWHAFQVPFQGSRGAEFSSDFCP